VVSITGMGNVIYDFLPDSPLNPFIGAGLGITPRFAWCPW
jgi:hypothetical protein